MATTLLGATSRGVRWLMRLVCGVFGGVWLFVLFLLSITLATLSLSAIQLRDQLDSDGKGEVSYTEVFNAKESFDTSLRALWGQYEQSVSRPERELRSLTARIESHAEMLQDWFVEPTPITEPYRGIGYEDFPDFQRTLAECAQDPIDLDTGQVWGVCETAQTISGLIGEYHALVDESPRVYQAAEATFLEQKDRIQAAQPLYKHFNDYGFFEFTGFDVLLILPRQVLVLVLTMAMGLLGSVVTMTWSFVRNDSGMTAQRFAVLPIVGMTTAFVVLVFIMAGQMTLTAGASGTLNPFALSFIGIISGLLSERAYGRLSDVGNTFFVTADAQLRWANHLKAAMEAGSISIEEVARHLGVTEEEVERIVNEAAPATLDQQRLIAACLRLPLRDLFTDAPPPEATDDRVLSVVVPHLIGLDETEAARSLRQVGLTLGKVTRRSDDRAAPGAVMLQSPRDGALIARSGKVDVTVSTGKAAAAPGDEPAPA